MEQMTQLSYEVNFHYSDIFHTPFMTLKTLVQKH